MTKNGVYLIPFSHLVMFICFSVTNDTVLSQEFFETEKYFLKIFQANLEKVFFSLKFKIFRLKFSAQILNMTHIDRTNNFDELKNYRDCKKLMMNFIIHKTHLCHPEKPHLRTYQGNCRESARSSVCRQIVK